MTHFVRHSRSAPMTVEPEPTFCTHPDEERGVCGNAAGEWIAPGVYFCPLHDTYINRRLVLDALFAEPDGSFLADLNKGAAA